jgi:rubrerythrin
MTSQQTEYGVTAAMMRAMKREEYWSQQRNGATTERALNYARKMEKRAAAAYASACKNQKN